MKLKGKICSFILVMLMLIMSMPTMVFAAEGSDAIFLTQPTDVTVPAFGKATVTATLASEPTLMRILIKNDETGRFESSPSFSYTSKEVSQNFYVSNKEGEYRLSVLVDGKWHDSDSFYVTITPSGSPFITQPTNVVVPAFGIATATATLASEPTLMRILIKNDATGEFDYSPAFEYTSKEISETFYASAREGEYRFNVFIGGVWYDSDSFIVTTTPGYPFITQPKDVVIVPSEKAVATATLSVAPSEVYIQKQREDGTFRNWTNLNTTALDITATFNKYDYDGVYRFSAVIGGVSYYSDSFNVTTGIVYPEYLTQPTDTSVPALGSVDVSAKFSMVPDEACIEVLNDEGSFEYLDDVVTNITTVSKTFYDDEFCVGKYRFAISTNGRWYYSDAFTISADSREPEFIIQPTDVTVPAFEAGVAITRFSQIPTSVQLCRKNESGSYGIWEDVSIYTQNIIMTFNGNYPDGEYCFRVDYNENIYWSDSFNVTVNHSDESVFLIQPQNVIIPSEGSMDVTATISYAPTELLIYKKDDSTGNFKVWTRKTYTSKDLSYTLYSTFPEGKYRLGVLVADVMYYSDSFILLTSPCTHTKTEIIEAVPATCTTAGLTEGSKCSVCGEILVAQTTVAAKGHTAVTDPAVAATVNSTGLTAGSHCSVCGEVIVAQQVVPKLTPATPDQPSQPPTPTQTPAQPEESESGVAGFVERLYTIALGRKSDSNGKAAWINAIKNGESGAEAAKGFLFSDEFLNKGMSNSDFVTTLYRTFFDREPDAAGHAAWVAALERGDSKQDVIMGFINSTEWANVCLKYGIASGGTGVPNITVEPNEQVIAFATRLYTTCLKRSPDQNGLMAWARQLANLRDTGSNAAHGFFFSDEMNNNPVSNEEFVTRLYLTFMDRQPDQGGMNAWVGQLNSGVSREEVFQGFAQSSEFGAICANYGIIR